MFLINRCMYWFVLVCTGTYHYVTLTQQYVHVCIFLYLYEQVCSSMYQYVLVCTCMYLLVWKSIITFSSQYQAVPAVTLNPVHLNGPVWRLCSVWFSLVQVYSGVQDSREVLGTAWYWDRSKLRQLVPRRVQGSTWQYQTEDDST